MLSVKINNEIIQEIPTYFKLKLCGKHDILNYIYSDIVIVHTDIYSPFRIYKFMIENCKYKFQIFITNLIYPGNLEMLK